MGKDRQINVASSKYMTRHPKFLCQLTIIDKILYYNICVTSLMPESPLRLKKVVGPNPPEIICNRRQAWTLYSDPTCWIQANSKEVGMSNAIEFAFCKSSHIFDTLAKQDEQYGPKL